MINKLPKKPEKFLDLIICSALGAAFFVSPFWQRAEASQRDGSISGYVLRQSSEKQPISDAEVYIDGRPQYSTLSDQTGHFQIPGIPVGTYNIAIRAYGFETDFLLNVPVKAAQDSNIEFSLPKVDVVVEKIVVIMVEFPDLRHDPRHDEGYFRRVLFGKDPGESSLRNYFYEVSKGRIDIQEGQFSGWITDNTHSHAEFDDSLRDDIADVAIHQAVSLIDFAKFDRLHNYDLSPGPDGRIDHIMIIHAGDPKSITNKKNDLNPTCMFNTEYIDDLKTTQQVFISEAAPLGNFVHEFFHDMGDRSVQDLYMGGTPPTVTVGQWEPMSVGMYNPLDSLSPPYFKNLGYLPSYPLPWTVQKWYHGTLKTMLGVVKVLSWGSQIDLTIFPFEIKGGRLKIVRIPLDEKREISVVVRKRLGFDRGLKGNGGVLISKIDYSQAGSMQLRGPVRVQDSHPGSQVPSYLHFTYDYELDDAAFGLGSGEVSHFESEGVRIDVKQANPDGSYLVTFAVK